MMGIAKSLLARQRGAANEFLSRHSYPHMIQSLRALGEVRMYWLIAAAVWLLPACYIVYRFGPADSVDPSVFERLFLILACLLWPILGAIAVTTIVWQKAKRRRTGVEVGFFIETRAHLFHVR
jgi:hypothetical protein